MRASIETSYGRSTPATMDGREPVVVEARRTSLVDVQATYVRVESLRTAGAPPPTDELVRLRVHPEGVVIGVARQQRLDLLRHMTKGWICCGLAWYKIGLRWYMIDLALVIYWKRHLEGGWIWGLIWDRCKRIMAIERTKGIPLPTRRLAAR